MSTGLAKRQLSNPANIGAGGGISTLNVQQYMIAGCRYCGNGTVATSIIPIGTQAVSSSGDLANARVAPTANDGPLILSGRAAVASPNTGGIALETDSINSGVVRGTLRRASVRVQHLQNTGSRYWLGLVASGNGPVGNAPGLANDTPNFSYAGFRFSGTTDATYKAAIGINTANQTLVNTGVVMDITRTKLFEIYFDGTNWVFLIDGTTVATFNSANSPLATTLLDLVCVVDNKNVAVIASMNFGWMMYSYA